MDPDELTEAERDAEVEAMKKLVTSWHPKLAPAKLSPFLAGGRVSAAPPVGAIGGLGLSAPASSSAGAMSTGVFASLQAKANAEQKDREWKEALLLYVLDMIGGAIVLNEYDVDEIMNASRGRALLVERNLMNDTLSVSIETKENGGD